MADITLYLGNRNYSSWSLRAWLMLKQVDVAFDEVVIPLDQTDTREQILRYSPSGRLPSLHYHGMVVWDSLAIGEFLAETFPGSRLWPEDRTARAQARSVAAEMHSGFGALREYFPMNFRSTFPNRKPTPEVQGDINRVSAIWRECRDRHGEGGPFLFGKLTIADAMFAPVVSRFGTYRIDLEPTARAYYDAMWELPAMNDWLSAAKKEPMVIDKYEF